MEEYMPMSTKKTYKTNNANKMNKTNKMNEIRNQDPNPVADPPDILDRSLPPSYTPRIVIENTLRRV